MARAARSNSLASLAGASLLFLMACAHPARELPPDLSSLPPSQRLLPDDVNSTEYGLSCDALLHQLAIVRQQGVQLDSRLRRTQADNRSKAIAGALVFTYMMLGMEDDTPIKDEYAKLEARKEQLLRISQARECSN